MRQRIRQGMIFAAVLVLAALMYAQAPPAAAPPAGPPPTAKASAPVDLTGYWVSIVTEDWRFRMVTPAKGDYASIPINLAAKQMADTWDPAKDEAAGEQCKSYGAPALMHVAGRVHVTWQDDNTLKVEMDNGQQTRLLHFGDWKPGAGPATWQGDSVASWELPGGGGRGGRGGGGGRAAAPPKFGSLKIVTTNLKPGYLRKNGVPYSDKATLTEYWDLSTEHYLSGSHKDEQWLVITSLVNDPTYLQEDWLTSPNFRKEPDGSKWDPQPCSSKW